MKCEPTSKHCEEHLHDFAADKESSLPATPSPPVSSPPQRPWTDSSAAPQRRPAAGGSGHPDRQRSAAASLVVKKAPSSPIIRGNIVLSSGSGPQLHWPPAARAAGCQSSSRPPAAVRGRACRGGGLGRRHTARPVVEAAPASPIVQAAAVSDGERDLPRQRLAAAAAVTGRGPAAG